MKRKPVLIAYDITSNKRRRQLFRILRTWKLDKQYSVFECKLSPVEAKELFLQLTELLNEEEDALFLSWLDNGREPLALTRCSSIGFQKPVLYAG